MRFSFLFRRTVRPCSESSWPSLVAVSARSAPGDTAVDAGGGTPSFGWAAHTHSLIAFPSPSELARLREASRFVAFNGAASELLFDALRFVRSRTEADGLAPPSDRRLVRTARALRIAACADGRDAVGAAEMLLLPHLLCARPADADALERWVEAELEGRAGSAGAIEYIACGLFGRVWELALLVDDATDAVGHAAEPRAPSREMVAEAEGLAEEALALLSAALAERGADGEFQLTPKPTPLWIAPDAVERNRAALQRAREDRRERLETIALDAATMACALGTFVASAGVTLADAAKGSAAEDLAARIEPASGAAQHGLSLPVLVDVLPRLSVNEVRSMLSDSAGEERQSRALRLLRDDLGMHVEEGGSNG